MAAEIDGLVERQGGAQEQNNATGHVAFYDRGYTNLVSVIPPGASLVPGSVIDPAKLGKIPGLRGADGRWRGYDFTRAPTPDRPTVELWEHDGANLGLLGKHNPGIDVDCDDAEVARRVEEVALRHFGPMPVRYGRKPRLLLVGRTEWPFNKLTLAFSLKSAPGSAHKIEVLGNGQYYLIAGCHPAGMLYTWKEKALADVSQEELPLLTTKSVEVFLDAVQAEFGDDFALTARGTSGDSSKAPPQELLRGDLEEMQAIVSALPNHFPDRDTYVRVAIAVKAALWDHPSEAFDLFFDWAIRWTEGTNSPEEIEKRWAGLKPPFRIGAQWLRNMLRQHNHSAAGALLVAKFEATVPDASPSSISNTSRDLVARTGLAALAKGATPRDVEESLRKVAAGLHGATALDRELVRSEAITALKGIGVEPAARLVDAALSSVSGAPSNNEGQGTGMVLAEVVPWPDLVDGVALLAEIEGVLKRHVVMADGADTAAMLWIVLAHAHDAFSVSPILAVTSPEKRCGKTTLLELLSALVPKTLFASNITTASLFRAIEAFRPTVLLDEADTFLGDNVELRGVLNSGHRRDSAFVIRLVGDQYEARQFGTWAPKAIGAIGRLPDTLEDRAVVVRMRRRRSDEPLQAMRLDRLGTLEHLRRKVARWAADHMDELRAADPAIPMGLHDRAADNWRPLLAIADAVSGEWPNRARRAAALLAGAAAEDQAPAEQLLADIRALFAERDAERLGSDEVVAHLLTLDERPWGDWRNGKPLTVIQLAALLVRFDIRPKKFRFGEATRRGYEQSQFDDAFARYLPSTSSSRVEHPEQSSRDAVSGSALERNTVGSVPHDEPPPNLLDGWDVPVVPSPAAGLRNHDAAGATSEEAELEALLYGTGAA